FLLVKSLNLFKFRRTPVIGAFLFSILPWNVFFARIGYEMNLALTIFSAGILALWLGLKKPWFIVFGFTLLSLSTYAAHTQLYLAPIFIIVFGAVFREVLFGKSHLKLTLTGIAIAVVLQIPHFFLLATPAFWNKTDLFYKSSSFFREFLSQFFTYFSPRSLFSLPDPDLQRSIPGLSVFYFWMIVPYLVGLYFLFRNIRASENKFVFILAVLAPIPASLAPDPFSTQRALPALLPLSLIIILGLDRLIFKKPLTLILLFPLLILSLFFLWRSYFLFLPKERARIWGYGFRELSEEIIRRPTEKFVIDEARIKPAYIELLFFLKYPPEKLHEAVEKSIKDNYYANPPFNSRYEFANIQTRGIIWEEDVYKNQILVGDKLAVSKEQATAHFLERVFEIRDPLGEIVFQGLRTNPVKKCLAYRDKRCDGVR
ncbi:MAG: hypothetical protein Q8N98_05100, partial [bacterium]|nr:hypothetical protein [bacterium]